MDLSDLHLSLKINRKDNLSRRSTRWSKSIMGNTVFTNCRKTQLCNPRILFLPADWKYQYFIRLRIVGSVVPGYLVLGQQAAVSWVSLHRRHPVSQRKLLCREHSERHPPSAWGFYQAACYRAVFTGLISVIHNNKQTKTVIDIRALKEPILSVTLKGAFHNLSVNLGKL